MPEAMEIEGSSNAAEDVVIEDEDDEDVEDLLDMMDNAKVSNAVALLTQVMESPKIGPKATQNHKNSTLES